MAMKEIFFQLTKMYTIVLYYCFFQTYLPDLYFMKIAVSLIHFLMCLLGVFQIISGSEFHTAISFPLVIGYGCSGFSLMSIGGQIFKSIAIVTNIVFVVFSMIGLVLFCHNIAHLGWSIRYRGIDGLYNHRSGWRIHHKTTKKVSLQRLK